MVDVLLLLVSIFVVLLLIVGAAALLVRARLAKTRQVLERRVRGDGDFVQLLVGNVRYSGADFGYSKVKNNGVLIVGDRCLYFQHFIEKTPSIVLPLGQIRDVTLVASFRGELPTLSGGYLVLHTSDNNRIGFLLKDPESVQTKIYALRNHGEDAAARRD
ncbi:hypothetical protein [Trichloromonas sp.]|uniref:hypothetical protein n=1 Tax=Trichloromonas sp. TaxID=3069249 RepID=UPI002A41733E|nr:hypothetical protein [Trichloromonas sp.]